MKKRILSLALALSMALAMLPATVWAAKPMDGESGGQTEVAEAPQEAPQEAAEHPRVSPRTAKDAADEGPETDESLQIEVVEPDEAQYDAGYSAVLTLPGDHDSYDWQLWAGEADGWTSLDVTGPTLPLTKEMFVSYAFRCVVEKDGAKTAGAPYAYNEDALTAPLGAGVDLLERGAAPFQDRWKESAYIAVAPGRCFDVYGKENGGYYKTTYCNGGYTISSVVDGTELFWGAVPNTDVSMGGSLTGRFTYDIVYGGRYVKITYQVTNNGSAEKTFKVGSFGDVMIDRNDGAEVVGTAAGLQMDDGAGKLFNLVVPTATTKWFGYYVDAFHNVFTPMSAGALATPYHGDSGMSWSWTGTVRPGQTWKRYALIGVGEIPDPLPDPSISIQLADGRDFATPGEAITVSGTATPGSMAYIDVGGREFKAPVAANGSFFGTVTIPNDAAEGPLDIQAQAVNETTGAISNTASATVNVKFPPFVTLTAAETWVEQAQVLDESWYRSFIKDTNATVTHTTISTATLSDKTITYTAKISSFAPATARLTVHILPKPAELTQTTAAQSGKSFPLKATLRYSGGLSYTETGFVYGSFQNPNLSFCDGQVRTAGPVSADGGQLTATVTGLTDNTAYYARAYAKASDGTVIYGPQSSAFGLGVPKYGTFSIKNNGNNTFTIYRASDQADGVQRVYYRTVNGSAVGMLNGDKYHFRHADGVLTFNDGEYEKTVTVTEFSNHAIYDSYVGTQYANADRTYQMEINRVEGGAVTGTRFATRNMGHNAAYEVRKSLYTSEHERSVATNNDNNYVADMSSKSWHCVTFINGRSKNNSHGNVNFNVQRNMDVGTANENTYLKATAAGYSYRLQFDAKEDNNGYEHIWISNHKPNNMTGDTEKDNHTNTSSVPRNYALFGDAYFTGRWEIGGWGGGSTATVSYPSQDGADRPYSDQDNSRISSDSNWVLFDPSDTAHVWFSASGNQTNIWHANWYKDWLKIRDDKEPQLIDVAYMARSSATTTYLPDDPITVSLIFDEIVDKQNSEAAGFGKDSYITMDMEGWGNTQFKYAGGLDTNVLYFTATTPAGAPAVSSNLKVNLDCAGQIKDMCPDNGSAPSNGASSTAPIGTVNPPTVSVGNITNASGTLSSVITATNADRLEYVWTNSSTTPTSGWRTLTNKSGGTVTTRQSAGSWYLHARATSVGGMVAKDSKGVSIPASGSGALVLPTLTAGVDNTAWARSRVITLTPTPSNAKVECIGGDVAAQSGNQFTVLENGSYTFRITVGGETATAMATVSRLDRTGPTVTFDALEAGRTYVEPVTLTVRAADSESGFKSLYGFWRSGDYPSETATFTKVSGGVYTTTSPGKTGAWRLTVTAEDKVGNESEAVSPTYTLNLNLPDVTVTKGSTNPNGSVNYTYSVNMNGQTIQTVQLPDGTLTTALSGSFTLTEPGTYYVVVSDTAGHVARSAAMTLAENPSNPVDGQPPELRLRPSTEEWVNAATGVTVTANVYDNIAPTSAAWKSETGTAKSFALVTDAAAGVGVRAKTGSFKVTANGTYTVTAQDARSNTGSTEIEITNIDAAAPTIGAPSGNPTAWTSNNASISFKVTDSQSGVKTVTAKKGSANVGLTAVGSTYSFSATANGDYTITATDAAGNTATQTVTVTKIDKAAPGLTVSGGTTAGASLELTVAATNSGGSGVTATVAKDGGAAQAVSGGKYTVNTAGSYVFTATTGAGLTKSQTVNVYAIAFDARGGSAVASKLVAYNGAFGTLPATARTGYTLQGWYTAATGGSKLTATSTVTANTTAYAQWALNAPTVTVTASPENAAATYTGSPVVTLTANPTHAVSGLSYSYQWYKGAAPLAGKTAATLSLTDVSDSGSYKVKVTASDGALTSAPGESAATTVTIAKAAPNLSDLSATAITYGDALSASTPSGTATDPEAGATLTGAWAWTASDAGTTYPTVVTDSGKTEYSVTFTPDDANFGPATGTVTLTVNKAVLTPSVNTVADKVYDGTTSATGTVKLAGAKFTDAPEAEGTFTFNSPNVTEASAVDVADIALTGGWEGNYVLSATSLSGIATTAKITPKPVTLTWNGADGLVYNGSSVNVTATAGALVGEDVCAVTVEGGTQTAAGDHTATATALDNPNYKLPEAATKTYTIAKATPALSGLTATDITYGDALSASTPSGTAQHPTTGVDVPGTWSWTAAAGTTYPTVVTDSGVTAYSVTFTPTDGDNYNTSTATVTLTVHKATLTPSVNTVSDKVYDGQTSATGTIKLAGAKFTDAPTAAGTFAFNSPNVNDANAVNVTAIALTGGWDGNYVLDATSLSGIATAARIAQKEVSLIWAGDQDLVYDRLPVNVTATAGALVEGDTCAVTVENGTQTNAGTYTAEAVSLDNPNYMLPEVVTRDYTIAKCPVTFTVTGNDQDYHHGGHPKAEVTAPGLTKDTEFTVSYRQTGEVIEPHFSGTYDIMVQLVDDNFKFEGQDDDCRELKVGDLTINHVSYEGAITWPTASNPITYGQPLRDVHFAGGSGSDAGGEGAFAWDVPDSFPDVATTQAVMIFDPDDPEYDPVEYEVDITVNRAVLTPSVASAADKVYDGSAATTGALSLSGAQFDEAPTAAGTFDFVDRNVADSKAVNVTAIALTGDWNANYVLSTETLSAIPTAAKITPKPVTLTWDGYRDLVYSGKPVNVTATAGALVEGDTCAVTVDDEARATHAGPHTATATALSDPNYMLPETVTWDYAIAPKPVTVLWHNMIQPYNGSDRAPKAVTEIGSGSAVTLQGVVPEDDGTADVVFTVTQSGQSARAVNAGTYTVSAAMKEGSNYAVTGYASAQLTVQKAPVTFTVTDNALKEGEPYRAPTITTDPADVPFTVVYKDEDGKVVDPETDDLKTGTYTVWVTLTDGDNYHHVGSATGDAAPIGVFTVYAKDPPSKYAVTFEADDPEDEPGADGGVIGVLSGSMEPLDAMEAGAVRILPKCAFACTGYAFAGWALDDRLYPAGAAYTQEGRDAAFTARWVKAVHSVEGVVDQDGKPISDVQVTLMLGANVIAQRHTDAAGKFRFENIAPGLYNLVATKDGVTMTVEAAIVDQDEARNITLPTHKTNSVVVVAPGTPDVVVGNLENNFTDEDKALAAENVNTEVEYKFTVRQEPIDENNADQAAIREAAGRATPGLFLELTLEKTVTEGDSVTTSAMPQSNVLIQSTIPLPAQLQGKHRYTVLRCHGDEVETLEEEAPNDAGEYFTVNEDKTVLTLYARKFSTYAVAYSDRHSGTIPFGSGTRPVCPRDETCPAAPFADLDLKLWYHDGIHFCVERELMIGTSKATFAPEMDTSRAMIATILWRLQGSKTATGPIPYPDVADGTWYTEAVRWATKEGVVKGYGDGTFGPDDPITREQLATMLYRYEQAYGKGGFTGSWMFLLDFHDADQVSTWANEAMHWMAMHRIIQGKDDNTLDPQGKATRAEAAALLQRYIQSADQ